MILELLKYYAKFPKREGVLNMFASGRSDMPEYEAVKKDIEALTEHSLLSIEGMILAANFDAMKSELDRTKADSVLMIDWGEITSQKEKLTLVDSWKIAVTVMYKLGKKDDLVEQAILYDRAMRTISDIRDIMRKDKERVTWMKEIGDTSTASPFCSPEFGMVGWTLIFERSGVGIWKK